MEQLNDERILAMWAVQNNKLTRPQSIEDTRWILHASIGKVLTETIQIDGNKSKEIASDYYHWRKSEKRTISKKYAITRVNRVLDNLNTMPGVEAKLTPLPHKVPRDSGYPLTARQMILAENMMSLDQHLLKWCQRTKDLDAWLLVLSLRMMSKIGMGQSIMLGTLASLTADHIIPPWLMIPSAPGESLQGGHYRLKLPDNVWKLLRHILTEANKGSTTWLFATMSRCEHLSHKEREITLEKRLRAIAKTCLSDLACQGGSHRWQDLKNWASLVEACQYTCVLRGEAATWGTLLKKYPLPTCTDMPLTTDCDKVHWYQPGAPSGRLPDRNPSRAAAGSAFFPGEFGHDTQAPGVSMIDTHHLPEDWPARAKFTLHQFLAAVRRLGKKRLTSRRMSLLCANCSIITTSGWKL